MLTRTSFLRLAFLSAVALVGFSVVAPAQDNNAAASAPMRAARLTSSQGAVTVTDGNNPPAAAQMNLPLLAGVQIATGDDGQAEIEFEDGSVARLTPNSALSLDRLDIAPGQLFVTDLSLLRGLAYFELRATPEYVYSVNAGGDMVSPVENVTLRINLDQPPASISVMDGTVQVERANSFKVDVLTGSTLREDANDASRYSVTQQIAADSWDQWNADMDQQATQQSDNSTTVRDNYAGAQGYGWSDMDASGTWYDVPGQGQVWQPYVADGDADFDPYGNGAWVWYSGTGYLWASAYPWGWTPYRCGGWSYYDSFGWGWAPGASCGGFGWGFGGGGFVVNIVRGPRGYRPIRVPVGRPGPIHPVVPVHIVADTRGRQWNGPAPNRGPRQIAGVTAKPIVPGHMTFTAGGGVNAGASLHRDFPIDRTTHTPALGLTSARTPNVYHVGPASASQNGQQQAQRPVTPDGRMRGLQQGNPQSSPPQQQAERPVFVQPQHTTSQQQDGRQAFQPQQNSQPQTPRFTTQQNNQPTQQRQTFSPQPQHTEPVHPSYTQQPAQPRQNFSPPPSAQSRYSPPPQPQQHFSPPPPPPPAPHVSAPAPSSGHK